MATFVHRKLPLELHVSHRSDKIPAWYMGVNAKKGQTTLTVSKRGLNQICYDLMVKIEHFAGYNGQNKKTLRASRGQLPPLAPLCRRLCKTAIFTTIISTKCCCGSNLFLLVRCSIILTFCTRTLFNITNLKLLVKLVIDERFAQ